MEKSNIMKRCSTCLFFYDVWANGSGKCRKGPVVITHADHGTTCKAYRFDQRYFEKELEF